jgi:hypothetical protein
VAHSGKRRNEIYLSGTREQIEEPTKRAVYKELNLELEYEKLAHRLDINLQSYHSTPASVQYLEEEDFKSLK